MSDSRAEMIEQFSIETQQHISEIEPILLAAEWEVPDKVRDRRFVPLLSLDQGPVAHAWLARPRDAGSSRRKSSGRSSRRPHAVSRPVYRICCCRAFDAIRLFVIVAFRASRMRPLRQPLVAELQAAAALGGTGVVEAMPPLPAGPVRAVLHDDADTLAYCAEMLAESLPNLAVLAGEPGDPRTGDRGYRGADPGRGKTATQRIATAAGAAHGSQPRCRWSTGWRM